MRRLDFCCLLQIAEQMKSGQINPNRRKSQAGAAMAMEQSQPRKSSVRDEF